MKTSDLDYSLPQDLIAQAPCDKRDESRLLIIDRKTQGFSEDVFRNMPEYLRPGDCLALNDTRVVRARLLGRKPTGGRVEVFLLRELEPQKWEALVRPSARVKPGTVVTIAESVDIVVEDVLDEGSRIIRFTQPDVLTTLERVGEIPLPPYIKRPTPVDVDTKRYQTVYAQIPGAVAAPTAGLHFTEDVFEALAKRGVDRAYLTLHVGYGTFRPIIAEDLSEHHVGPEEYDFPAETAEKLNAVRAGGGRVVAVGTTATRVLETQWRDGLFEPGHAITNAYFYPPYDFRAVDVLQTNFHLPRSSLLALVCAFGGTELILEAYRYAVRERFRFYSYGDVMLIL